MLAGNAEVQGESGTFRCYPVISNVAITPTPPHSRSGVWVAESTNQTVTWSVNGSNQVEKVDIWYVKAGDSDLSLASDVVTSESCGTITVPAVRATGVTVRVEDDATAFKSYVKESSSPFNVYGKVTTTLPDANSTYIVGSTTSLVKWDYDGNISNVDIYVDYDYDVGSPSWTLLATAAANLGATGWTWEDPGNLPDPPYEGVGDHVGNLIKVKVTDHDYPQDEKTYAVLSGTFSIVGGFTFLSRLNNTGYAHHIDNNNNPTPPTPVPIAWTSTGAAITTVKLEYYNGTTWTTIKSDVDNTGGKTYNWGTSSPGPLPMDLASNNMKIRISAS